MIGVNFEIKAGTDLHRTIVREIDQRQNHSQNKMSKRYEKWREMDDTQVAFVKEREVDTIRRAAKKSGGLTDYVQIEVPYSYGMMMTEHTYLSSVFLSRDPIFQFTARHGEPQQSVLAMEALIAYQTRTGKHLPAHYIWLYDACKYGVGIIGRFWDKTVSRYSTIEERPKTFLGQPTGEMEKVRVTKNIDGYEGNRLFNIRPYKFFHDPRVTYNNLQAGEYCGYETEMAWNDLVNGEATGKYFNLEALSKRQSANQADRAEEGSQRIEWTEPQNNIEGPSGGFDKGFVNILQFYIRLIPNDWNLGSSKLPEIWCFTIGNSETIIEARPLGEINDEFPFYTTESEIEGYGLFKRGVLETMQPMNDIMTWLFNSHFFNVRANMNNQLVYDPSRVVMKDILDPSPGKRIRLKPDAYGTDPKLAVAQLQVSDVTSNHINDVAAIGDLMQRTLGVNDNIMGQLDSGGRKTATEVRSSTSLGINRLKTVAEWMSATSYDPLSMALVSTSQQHYSQEQKFRVVGDIQISQPFVDVNPETLAGSFDFVPVDGTLPVDRFAQANLWTQMLQGLASDEQLRAQYDIGGIFAWVAQLSGLKNIHQFKINVAKAPGQLEEEVDKGNLVPVSEIPGQLPDIGEV